MSTYYRNPPTSYHLQHRPLRSRRHINISTKASQMSDSLALIAASRVNINCNKSESLSPRINSPYQYAFFSSPRNYRNDKKFMDTVVEEDMKIEQSPKLKLCRDFLESSDFYTSRVQNKINEYKPNSHTESIISNDDIEEFKGYSFHNVKKYIYRKNKSSAATTDKSYNTIRRHEPTPKV